MGAKNSKDNKKNPGATVPKPNVAPSQNGPCPAGYQLINPNQNTNGMVQPFQPTNPVINYSVPQVLPIPPQSGFQPGFQTGQLVPKPTPNIITPMPSYNLPIYQDYNNQNLPRPNDRYPTTVINQYITGDKIRIVEDFDNNFNARRKSNGSVHSYRAIEEMNANRSRKNSAASIHSVNHKNNMQPIPVGIKTY